MIKVTDSDIYPLQGTSNRFVHICTLERQTVFGKLNTYIYFHDRVTGKRYCEEIIGGHLEQIMDEKLILEIEQFVLENGYAQLMIT